MGELTRNTALTIGTSQIIVSNEISQGQRTVINLTNASTGAQVISISIDGQPTAGSGIVLYPGATWTESIDGVFKPTNKGIIAISNGAGASLAIHERINLAGV